jgi:hypothetical protein
MKFTIYAPNYNDKSGGAWVLHFLCDQLNKIGHESKIFIYEASQVVNPQFDTPIGYLEDSVVVYPEIIVDNPLNATKVVRYLLNREGALQKRMISWGNTDYPLAFSRAYRNDCEVLFYPNCDLSIFYDNGTERTQNAFYIGKGELTGDCPKLDCFEITRTFPSTKQELGDVLRRSKILFSYDALSATNTDAALCGCLPYLLQKPITGLENAELGKYWAESAGEIEQALEQMSTLYERIEGLQQSFPERLADQVKKIANHFAL